MDFAAREAEIISEFNSASRRVPAVTLPKFFIPVSPENLDKFDHLIQPKSVSFENFASKYIMSKRFLQDCLQREAVMG